MKLCIDFLHELNMTFNVFTNKYFQIVFINVGMYILIHYTFDEPMFFLKFNVFILVLCH